MGAYARSGDQVSMLQTHGDNKRTSYDPRARAIGCIELTIIVFDPINRTL